MSVHFKATKARDEKVYLGFTAENEEVYKKAFTVGEKELALRRLQNTVTTPDDIHYKMV